MSKRRTTPKWLKAARLADASPTSRRAQAGNEASDAARPDWLARALSRAGVLPLVEAEQAIRRGKVTVNRKVVTQPFAPVREGDVVAVDGRRVSLAVATRVLAFHKPAGVVTSGTDAQGQGTVFERLFEVLPRELRTFGWHAVGRLDRNTTGLLLFTNDERFVQHATSPKSHLPKRYLATVSGKLDDAKLEPLRRGMELDDGPTLPARASIRAPGVVELTLFEGRNHQVKRMLGAVGLPVTALHREAIGTLECDVPVGQLRELSEAEIREALGYATSRRSSP